MRHCSQLARTNTFLLSGVVIVYNTSAYKKGSVDLGYHTRCHTRYAPGTHTHQRKETPSHSNGANISPAAQAGQESERWKQKRASVCACVRADVRVYMCLGVCACVRVRVCGIPHTNKRPNSQDTTREPDQYDPRDVWARAALGCCRCASHILPTHFSLYAL